MNPQPNRIALLRGINVSGRNKVPMAELATLCTEQLGWSAVSTWLQTGNVLFFSEEEPSALEGALEEVVHRTFGVASPVIVRTALEYRRIVEACPFPGQAGASPSRTLLYLAKVPLVAGATDSLTERARHGEEIHASTGALWIHFPKGVGSSKLTPAAIDRAVGSPATGRNWNTLSKLCGLLA